MAIVDDYADIAAELRRIKAERRREPEEPPDERRCGSNPPHSVGRATPAGEALYRRVVLQQVTRALGRRTATLGEL